MDERTQKKLNYLRRKIRNRENGIDMDRVVSSTNSETQTQVGEQNEEYGRALQAELSKMPTPKVSDIEPRSAFIKYNPPDFDTKEFDVNPSKFLYDLMLCEKGRDRKYTCVYQGDASERALKDLKPATEYHLKVCAVLGDYRGSPSEAISFMTKTCEPDPPQPPKFDKKSKSSISLKWNAPYDNGSKINNYVLEYEGGETEGNFIGVYRGAKKQYRVSRLAAATKYTFRLSAVNTVGQSDYSEPVVYYTSGSCPSQPDPPVLSERYDTEIVLTWAQRASDDEYSLHMDDEISGHGFIPVYNGTSTSHRITKLYRNKEYKFKLAAVNEEGTSKWSDVVAFRTLSDKPAERQGQGSHGQELPWQQGQSFGPQSQQSTQTGLGQQNYSRQDVFNRGIVITDCSPMMNPANNQKDQMSLLPEPSLLHNRPPGQGDRMGVLAMPNLVYITPPQEFSPAGSNPSNTRSGMPAIKKQEEDHKRKEQENLRQQQMARQNEEQPNRGPPKTPFNPNPTMLSGAGPRPLSSSTKLLNSESEDSFQKLGANQLNRFHFKSSWGRRGTQPLPPRPQTASVQDKAVVDSTPPQPPQRKWISLPHSNRRRQAGSDTGGATFTVMSYNVLCDKYCTPEKYPYCLSDALKWEYRKKLIMKEIQDWAADIICLQEVQEDQYNIFFKPELESKGYEGIFEPKSLTRLMTVEELNKKHVDGCYPHTF